jgi:hypothetical protein
VSGRFKKIVVSYGIPLGILFSAGILMRTVPHFGWHVLHGFHCNLRDVRVWVPFSYRAVSGTPNTLALIAFRGLNPTPREEVKAGTIMINFIESEMARLPLEITLGQGIIALNTDGPFVKKDERDITMAGRKGRCLEYGINTGPNSESLVDNDTIKIYCWFGNDLRASFLGRSSSAREFYEIVASARAAGGTR